MKMMTGIRLQIQAREAARTYVHNVEIDNWEELSIFHVKPKGQNISSGDLFYDINDKLRQQAEMNGTKEPVVLIGDEFDIAIYKVTEPSQENNQLQLELNKPIYEQLELEFN